MLVFRCPVSRLTVEEEGAGCEEKELEGVGGTARNQHRGLVGNSHDLESPLKVPLSYTWLFADSRLNRALVNTEALVFAEYGSAIRKKII